jgi:putative sterol carrier protein
MPRFLSDEWIAALDLAAEHVEVDPTLSLVLQQVVDDPDGTVTYHVIFDGGRVRVRPGPAPEPTVTFTVDRPTAEAIAAGEQSAQSAFMAGRLRLTGDVTVLLDAHEALERLAGLFAEVRASTTA